MKNLYLLLSLCLALASCTEILFEDPQPLAANSLKKIPKEFQGGFSFVVLSEQTYMEIGENYISDEDGRTYLSDSLIIKKVGTHYVVNKKISEGDLKEGKWQVYLLEDKGCGFIKATAFVINSDSYMEEFQNKYEATLLGDGQEKSMVVKPSVEQFNTILTDDSVRVSVILERVK